MADTFDDEPLDSGLERLALRLADGHSLNLDEAAEPSGGRANVVRGLRALEAVALGVGFLRPGTAPEYRSPELERWGALRILEPIGHGAFGDVYRAFDPSLHREVALKLVRSRRNALQVDRAVQEGRRLAKIDHENVVTVFGADLIDGQYGIWMKLLSGRTLAAEVDERGPLPEDEAASIVRSVASALAAVHSADIVHRDVKAQNVILTGNRVPVLTDFGTGRDLQASESEPRERAGTPVYAAPETLISGAATPLSDIYSLGVLLYFLLSARYPVSGHSLSDIAGAHVSEQRVPLEQRRPGVNRELAAIVSRSTQPDPADRYQSAADVVHALDRYLANQTWRRGLVEGLTSGGASWIDAWLRLPLQQRVSAALVAGAVTLMFGTATLYFNVDTHFSNDARRLDFKSQIVAATKDFATVIPAGNKAYVTTALNRLAMFSGFNAHTLRLACVYDANRRLFTTVRKDGLGKSAAVPTACPPEAPANESRMIGSNVYHFVYRQGLNGRQFVIAVWMQQALAMTLKTQASWILRYLFGSYLLLWAIPWTCWLARRERSRRDHLGAL